MNIFALSDCPVQSAKWHNNKHCVKMVTEIQQCLACAVIRHNAPTELLPLTKSGNPVRGGYHHHPSSIWAGNTRGNFDWLCRHGLALAKEYTERYGKTHFCEAQIKQLAALSNYIPDGDREDFAIAISDDTECRKIPGFDKLSSVNKYRLYYIHDKNHLADWKQNKPEWYTSSTRSSVDRAIAF